jgi:hypothetical protein
MSDVGTPGTAHKIPPRLVSHDEQDIWLAGHRLIHSMRRGCWRCEVRNMWTARRGRERAGAYQFQAWGFECRYVIVVSECFIMRVMCHAFYFFILTALAAAAPTVAGNGAYEPTRPPRVTGLPVGAHGFYAEFRGRSEDGGFGHAYIVLGALDATGNRVDTAVFGFVPKGPEDQRWSGIAVPVEGLVGVSRSDFTQRPDVSFRVPIRRANYQRLVRDLRGFQADWKVYALVGQNCNDLVGAVAHSLGLQTPLIGLQMPTSYVAELWALNPPAAAAKTSRFNTTPDDFASGLLKSPSR